jgi:hypothetical protein
MNDLHTGLRLYRDQLREAVERDLAGPGRRAVSLPPWALRVAVPAVAAGAVAAALMLTLAGGP